MENMTSLARQQTELWNECSKELVIGLFVFVYIHSFQERTITCWFNYTPNAKQPNPSLSEIVTWQLSLVQYLTCNDFCFLLHFSHSLGHCRSKWLILCSLAWCCIPSICKLPLGLKFGICFSRLPWKYFNYV